MILDEKRPGFQIQFYTKPGCCLCDEALAELEALGGEFQLEIEKIDISKSPDLTRRYGQDIPVAEMAGRRLFKHRTSRAALRRLLDRACGPV